MAFQGNFTCNSFKEALFKGDVDFLVDTIKIALYNNTATLNASTGAYTATGEVTATGYTAGGVTMTGVTINTQTAGPDAGTVYVNFDNVSWPGANFTARGALIYNTTRSNKTVAVLDFGSDKTFTSTNNTVTMPANTATTALIRFP
jgi:hypothetical protein